MQERSEPQPSTGLPDIDRLFESHGGLRTGQMRVIAARPAVGRSMLPAVKTDGLDLEGPAHAG